MFHTAYQFKQKKFLSIYLLTSKVSMGLFLNPIRALPATLRTSELNRALFECVCVNANRNSLYELLKQVKTHSLQFSVIFNLTILKQTACKMTNCRIANNQCIQTN